MDLLTTILALAAGLAISGVALWLERRPKTTLDVRLLPTTPFLLAGALITLTASIHLLTFLRAH